MKLLDRRRAGSPRGTNSLLADSGPDLWSLFTRKITFKVPRPLAYNLPDVRQTCIEEEEIGRLHFPHVVHEYDFNAQQDLLDEAAVEEMPQLCVVHEFESITTAQVVKKRKTRRGKRGGK
ncbi:hypothetical protein FRC12_017182 [Ceratobasidium sp. 428]|nr:hypothetical protein FRC12_017182 [Ceratobasidium sp. 428]